jgi:hypothetical protein
VIDEQGRFLGHQEFSATEGGYAALLGWMRSQGRLGAIGVESTGSFGAALTRSLTAAGERVIEVNRPSPPARRMEGTSDCLDAGQIARSVVAVTCNSPFGIRLDRCAIRRPAGIRKPYARGGRSAQPWLTAGLAHGGTSR